LSNQWFENAELFSKSERNNTTDAAEKPKAEPKSETKPAAKPAAKKKK